LPQDRIRNRMEKKPRWQGNEIANNLVKPPAVGTMRWGISRGGRLTNTQLFRPLRLQGGGGPIGWGTLWLPHRGDGVGPSSRLPLGVFIRGPKKTRDQKISWSEGKTVGAVSSSFPLRQAVQNERSGPGDSNVPVEGGKPGDGPGLGPVGGQLGGAPHYGLGEGLFAPGLAKKPAWKKRQAGGRTALPGTCVADLHKTWAGFAWGTMSFAGPGLCLDGFNGRYPAHQDIGCSAGSSKTRTPAAWRKSGEVAPKLWFDLRDKPSGPEVMWSEGSGLK